MLKVEIMNKKIVLALVGIAIVALLVLFWLPIKVSAVTDTDIANITVQVATKTAIDVNPAALAWLGVDPGTVGGPSQEALGPNYYAIQIENIGSHNISKIWFNATYPSSRPFATGTNASYDAGNFVVLARESSNNFYFPNRLEFNESRTLVYLRDPSNNLPPDGTHYSYGRFRNTSFEYFWMVDRSDVNCDGNTFYIGNVPHTESQTGTTNFVSGDFSTVTLTASTSHPGWCYADITVGGAGGEPYTIYVKNETYDQVFFVHWNKDWGEGSNAEYFWDMSGNPGYPLVPGNSTAALIRVFVPYGVHEGYVKQGILTVIAEGA